MNLKRKNQDILVINKQKEIKKGIQLLGSAKILPNHKVFEFNTETKVLKQADEMQEKIISWDQALKIAKKKFKIHVKEKCIYIHAMNLKNARKKLLKEYKSAV